MTPPQTGFRTHAVEVGLSQTADAKAARPHYLQAIMDTGQGSLRRVSRSWNMGRGVSLRFSSAAGIPVAGRPLLPA